MLKMGIVAAIAPLSPGLHHRFCSGLAHRAQARLRTRQERDTSTAGLCNIMERGISQHSQRSQQEDCSRANWAEMSCEEAA